MMEHLRIGCYMLALKFILFACNHEKQLNVDRTSKEWPKSDRSRSIAKDSIAGAVPEKYFVVLNSDLVRVRYLLVYSKHSEYSRSLASKSMLGWFSRHKMLTCAIGYIIFLASVGLSNSPVVQRLINLLLKRVGF